MDIAYRHFEEAIEKYGLSPQEDNRRKRKNFVYPGCVVLCINKVKHCQWLSLIIIDGWRFFRV